MDRNPFRGIVRKTGPGLAIQEVLYGFIMALIYVTAARIGILRYTDTLNLVILIIGMNFTWGLIDAVVFYMVDVFDQRKFVRIMSACDLPHERKVEMMLDEFSGTPLDILDPEDERRICEEILSKTMESESERLSDRMAMRDSAVACFIITILTTIPIVVPLLLIEDTEIALAVASGLSSICLFFIGFRMERYLGVNRWAAGLFLTAIGWAITITATFTGG
ncbi:MAG: hypothetical protein ACI381_03715 [Candidatus Methanomethylophilaceae archaeon]